MVCTWATGVGQVTLHKSWTYWYFIRFTSEIVTRPNYESYFELFRHPIASKTLYLCIEAFTSSNSDERDLLDSFKRWRPLFEDIEHSALCRNEKCDKHGTDQCLDVLRETFERGFAHIGALSCTEKEAGPILQSAIAMWTKTSDLLAVTETTVRERMKLLRKCCNFKCTQAYQMHRQKRYRCVSCETVYYCNRNCQKEWASNPYLVSCVDRREETGRPTSLSVIPNILRHGIDFKSFTNLIWFPPVAPALTAP